MQTGQVIEEPRDVALEEKLAFLRQPLAYPDNPKRVETIETHKSWVFMTERFVYKLKKPIRYNSADFRELATRCHFCQEELSLNQALAAGTYVDVAKLRRDDCGTLSISGSGQIVECLVKMRRLPAQRFMSSLIAAGRMEITDIARLSNLLTGFYRSSSPMPVTTDQYRATLEREIRLNVVTEQGVDSALAALVQSRQLDFLRTSAAQFDDRVSRSRIVDGHGDLRPEHICLVDPPAIIDRLEFDPLLRIVDPVDELSFFSLECERLGAQEIGDRIFHEYCQLTGDRPPDPLVRFYKSYRAAMWARLAAWRIRDAAEARRNSWIARANEYLGIAERYLPGD